MIQQKVHQKVNDIEEIELELTRFNAGRALSSQDKRLEEIRIGSARLLIEATGPDSLYYNRVKGFGIADLEHLDQIVSEYEQRNARPCFDMAPTRLNEQVALALHRKGFLPTDQLAFLEAEPAEAAAVHPDITIEPVDEGNVDVLLEAVSDLMGGVPADILARKNGTLPSQNFGITSPIRMASWPGSDQCSSMREKAIWPTIIPCPRLGAGDARRR